MSAYLIRLFPEKNRLKSYTRTEITVEIDLYVRIIIILKGVALKKPEVVKGVKAGTSLRDMSPGQVGFVKPHEHSLYLTFHFSHCGKYAIKEQIKIHYHEHHHYYGSCPIMSV